MAARSVADTGCCVGVGTGSGFRRADAGGIGRSLSCQYSAVASEPALLRGISRYELGPNSYDKDRA